MGVETIGAPVQSRLQLARHYGARGVLCLLMPRVWEHQGNEAESSGRQVLERLDGGSDTAACHHENNTWIVSELKISTNGL